MITVFDAARTAAMEQGLRAIGLSSQEDRLLGWLYVAPGSSMTESAAGTFTDRTTLTRVVERLVASGRVQREVSKTDRRRVHLWLTPRGVDLVRQAAAVTDDVNKTYRGVLDPAAISSVRRSLLRLLEAAVPDAEMRDTLTARNLHRDNSRYLLRSI